MCPLNLNQTQNSFNFQLCHGFLKHVCKAKAVRQLGRYEKPFLLPEIKTTIFR